MIATLPDGYRLRRGRADDIEPLTSLLVREEEALRGESPWGVEDTEDWWRMLAERDGEQWVVVDDEHDVPVAVLGIMQRQDLFNSWIAIDPAHAGRGIGRALLPHAEARTRARRGSRLYIDTFAENTAARELFEQSGYREARRHYRMQIDFDERPAEPAGSDGITYSNFDRERDARGFYDALNESFAGQWGFRTLPFEEWVRIRLDGPDFDPSIWFVARDGDEVVGILRGESRRWGGGWVGMIGVRPVWQRRGVGSRLLAAAFRAFYDRGERHVGLGVDTENPTGATRVYERAGMRVVQEMITYAKELT